MSDRGFGGTLDQRYAIVSAIGNDRVVVRDSPKDLTRDVFFRRLRTDLRVV